MINSGKNLSWQCDVISNQAKHHDVISKRHLLCSFTLIVMATFALRFFYDPAQLPESARRSKEALDSFFAEDPIVSSAQMAFVPENHARFQPGPAGYGFAYVRQLPTTGTLAGIRCVRIEHHINGRVPKIIYEEVEIADVGEEEEVEDVDEEEEVEDADEEDEAGDQNDTG